MYLQNHLSIPVFLLLVTIGFALMSCESETTDKNDPESLEREEELEQEIKQERDDTVQTANPIYVAALEGTNEAKGDTKANGKLILTVQNDSAYIKGEFSGLTSDFTDAYLHKVLQSERIRRLEPSLADDKRSGTIEASFELDQDAKNLIEGDSLYISIHTSNYDNSGEISGQFAARDTIPELQENEN